MLKSPVAQSTPKLIPIQRRPGIKDPRKSQRLESISKEEHYSSEEYVSDNDELENDSPAPENCLNDTKTKTTNTHLGLVLCLALLVIGILVYSLKGSNNYPKLTEIKELQVRYGAQEDDFWLSFKVLVEDTVKLKQPKCLILLYNDDTMHFIGQFLDDLSSYAVCRITNCTSKPIVLEASDFGHNDVLSDYGNIIVTTKDKLSENGVMIVKNLEAIPGKSALAFQSLCDEYQPVVEKALFLLTLKMEKNPWDKTKFVEHILRKKWIELNEDLFYPLLTRISNMIFIVQKNDKH